MGEPLNDIKIRLINRITLLNNVQLLGLLEKLLAAEPLSREDLLLLALASPLKDKTDLNQLISEQNYEGPDRGHFEQAVAQMNIEEPIEKLIDQLTS